MRFRRANNYIRIAYRMGIFPPFRHLLGGRKAYAYQGFLGDNNYGDELVYQATIDIFHPDILVPIQRIMPIGHLLFSRILPSRYAGIVIGGGTLIGPSFYESSLFCRLAEQGKQIFLHGTGVYKTRFWNPDWLRFFRKPVAGGVRGSRSAANFAASVPEFVEPIGDACFALYDPSATRPKGTISNILLINCGTHKPYSNFLACRAAMHSVIADHLAVGGQIQFLPCHAIDIEIAGELQQRVSAIQILPIPKNLAEALPHFRRAQFALGERLHFTATAILAHCPFFSINYADKHDDLLESVGLDRFGAHPAAITRTLIDQARAADETFSWDQASAALLRFRTLQRERALAFRQATTA